MEKNIPKFLNEKLLNQYGKDLTSSIIQGYSTKRPVTLRVNTLKTDVNTIKEILIKNNLQFKEVIWSKTALILENTTENEIRKLDIYNNGEIYFQSLSSMIPAIILDTKENENILDMAAAPGGKTTQMSAISNNNALITACEKNKIRFERLKYNIEKQGANRVNLLLVDARNLDNYFSFDKILLDAPCSGSGTLNINDENSIKYFNEELIKRSKKVQFELLKKAINILKPDGEMVYSTCSILKEENEDNLLKILNNKNIEIMQINEEEFKYLPKLPVSIKETLCICPNELYEGFFIAKLKKKK